MPINEKPVQVRTTSLLTPKADTMSIPKENPSVLVTQQPDQSPASIACKPTANMKEITIPINGTTVDGNSGTSSLEKAITQEPEDNIDIWSCGGEDTTI